MLAVLTGCASLADARQGRGSGKKVTYAADWDQVWADLPEAIRTAGLSVVAVSKTDGEVLAERGPTLWSWGENVAVYVVSRGAGHCEVEIVSKKTMKTNVLAPDWTESILARLDREFIRVDAASGRTSESVR
jgi:hypothetical protein